jgi:hypothetical protein
MMHPGFDRLRAFAEAEPGAAPAARVVAHLSRCGECRHTVSSIRNTRAAMRQATDLTLPAATWPRIAARLQAGDIALVPVAETTGRVHARPRAAAAITIGLLAAGTAVAALTVGRDLLDWFYSLRGERTPEPAVPALPAPPVAPLVAEFAIPPEGDEVLIRIEQPLSGLRLRVRLVDGRDVGVRATQTAAAARFRSGPGRITIAQAGAGEVQIDVPRGVPTVRIEVDGRVWVTKEGAQLHVQAPVVDTTGSELLIPIR